MFIYYNPNRKGKNVGDCTIRALTKALNVSWDEAYWMTCEAGFDMGDMPSSDSVWGSVLKAHGFYRRTISNLCPDCYTAEDFCLDNPVGIFVLGFGGHVATVIDGILYDSQDSSQEIPIYVWHKKEKAYGTL